MTFGLVELECLRVTTWLEPGSPTEPTSRPFVSCWEIRRSYFLSQKGFSSRKSTLTKERQHEQLISLKP
ncbi:hypothetical protein H671_1g0516 [Cricetulus griseus]|nr:hypothetical protein H671_1g0516 [Cricetulus griseus]